MALLKTIPYPNGGRLLIFGKNKVKYQPSPAYEEARKLAQRSPSTTPKASKSNPLMSANKLFDAIFAGVEFSDNNVSKTTVAEGLHTVIENKRTPAKEEPIESHQPRRTSTPNFLRTGTFR